ncbi:MAG: LamG-like jellyroll fold domain-containing protein [Planctomycetota bacterium]|jgi:hypothetical protein
MKKVILLVLVLVLGLAAEVANADFTFGTPTNLGPPVNTSSGEVVDCFSADGLEMYFDSDRSGGYGRFDLWVARRPTTDDSWGTPENLGSTVNTGQHDIGANISVDGLELYFVSDNRPRGYGDLDIWVTRRPTKDDAWGTPVNLGPEVNTSARDTGPSISTDGLELYFAARNRAGGYGSDDIWVTSRATKNDPWESPINLGAVVNTSASEDGPFLSADGLALFFLDDRREPHRPGGYGSIDNWVTTRANVSDPWGTPVNLGPIVNTASLDGSARISPDGFTLYFSSERPGGFGGYWGDIYQAPIIPIVDFNGDGIVDSADMCIMVDRWGEDYSLCDIGPMPWGDGIVDVQDLIVLAEYLFEDVNDPTLIAHWALDETEGNIAHDNAAANDGTVHGDPTWQPEGGHVDGALQLDGIDDYVGTPFVLNPADGKFSVFAWIKGGGPRQVIISQTDGTGMGATWLSADPLDGKLMTMLMPPSTGLRIPPQPLVSEFIITDGNWHRIGFVWDGSYRYLYVDGAEVAKDTQSFSILESSDGGLYLGAGKDLEPGSFFSGLIDNVRIYDRAVTP